MQPAQAHTEWKENSSVFNRALESVKRMSAALPLSGIQKTEYSNSAATIMKGL